MNISKATLSFDSKPNVSIGGQKKEFGELTINGKTFQGVDLGNGTFAKLKARPDGKFDVKTFHGRGKDLSALSVKVNGGTVSRIKTTDGQRFNGAGATQLKGQTLRFNSDFAHGYTSAGTTHGGEVKDKESGDKTISFNAPLKPSDITIGTSSEKKEDWFKDKFFQKPLTDFFEDDDNNQINGQQPRIKSDTRSIKNKEPDMDKLETLLNELSEPIDEKDAKMPDLGLLKNEGTSELDKLLEDLGLPSGDTGKISNEEKSYSDEEIDKLFGDDIFHEPHNNEVSDGVVETYGESKTPRLDKLIDKMNANGGGFEIKDEN